MSAGLGTVPAMGSAGALARRRRRRRGPSRVANAAWMVVRWRHRARALVVGLGDVRSGSVDEGVTRAHGLVSIAELPDGFGRAQEQRGRGEGIGHLVEERAGVGRGEVDQDVAAEDDLAGADLTGDGMEQVVMEVADSGPDVAVDDPGVAVSGQVACDPVRGQPTQLA